MENNKGSHKEEIWVENLCKKIMKMRILNHGQKIGMLLKIMFH